MERQSHPRRRNSLSSPRRSTRNRLSGDLRNNMTVYVVSEMDRTAIAHGVDDGQQDVEVLGVFSSSSDAERFCNRSAVTRSVVIHHSVLNPFQYVALFPDLST